MNHIQSVFIELLKCGIHGEKAMDIKQENINWEGVIEEAKAHKVEAIIYSAIDKSYHKYINENTLNELRRNIFLSVMIQNRYMKQTRKILDKFNEENIEVIMLKGPVLRELYPHPEFRTMSDLDIFIHKHDLGRIEKLIYEWGYKKESMYEWILEYVKGTDIRIELKSPYKFKERMEEEEVLWKNSMKVKILDSEALSLGLEDTVVQLCVHMANHIINTGFGVRQLCDMVLLVEKKGNQIDWNIVSEKTKIYGIEKFTLAIFKVCNNLFNMSIPKELDKEELNDSAYIEYLIDTIFQCGVFGKRYMSQSISGRMANQESNKKSVCILKKLLAEVFIPKRRLADKYRYVNKSIFLIPIGWMHRFFDVIFTTEYKPLEKLKLPFTAYIIAKQKNKLFNWLEL